MSFNLNKPKVRVMITLALIALVVSLVVTVKFINNNVVANKISENIDPSNKVDSGFVGIQVMVKPTQIVKSKQIGYISKVYEEDGKRYLRFDDVKFLMGNEAIEAAKKDGAAEYENGEYFVYDDYYIVNSSEKTKNYIIDDKASLNLLGCWIDPYNGDGNNHSVSYNNFKNVSSVNEHMLCYIYAENDVVVKVEGQYTP
ncbi:hypothetical protein [Clostridium sp.]|uniref:hypothetical protein n=1 Tax=Clostridium sp. TaxID=1506 RepID=UPI001A3D6F89|nr:hypothetical protein [Clostridium sp.]MBK5240292.1 hypothetical protein [Clostridium sp.]